MYLKLTRLDLSWATSRGRDTYGYNIARLDDSTTGKRYKCMGGGYDMIGTCFGDFLQDVYQLRLKEIASMAGHTFNKQGHERTRSEKPQWYSHHDKPKSECSLYGMTANYLGSELYHVRLDGGCGLDSMIRIAEAIGLSVQRTYGRGRNAKLNGLIVSEPDAERNTKEAS